MKFESGSLLFGRAVQHPGAHRIGIVYQIISDGLVLLGNHQIADKDYNPDAVYAPVAAIGVLRFLSSLRHSDGMGHVPLDQTSAAHS